MLNKENKDIQFAIENENNGIPFLDVFIIRHNNTIKTNWFRKQIWSGRYLNFESFHYFSYKLSLVNSLTDRAVLLSDESFHKENLNLVFGTSKQNNCPENLLVRPITNRLSLFEKIMNNNNNNNNNNDQNIMDNKKVLTLAYLKNVIYDFTNVFNFKNAQRER